MASIHTHGKGHRVHYAKDGAPAKSQTFPTREEAAAWMRDNLPTILDDGMFGIIDAWRAEAPSPYREDAADRLSNLVAKRRWLRADHISAHDLKTWVKEDASWRRPCQYLRTVLRWAQSEHHVPVRSEVLLWRPPRQGRRPKPALLSDQQANAIRVRAALLGPRVAAVIDYLMTYGARPITACRLRTSSFDYEHGDLVLGARDASSKREGEKHSGGWRHRLYPHHIDGWPGMWWDGKPEDIPIFPHYQEDRPWRLNRGRAEELGCFYVNRIGRPLKETLGTLTGIYHLKRYAITRLFRAKVDPGTIALFTGHLDEKQLMTYATSNSDLQEQALEALDAFNSQINSQIPKVPDVSH